MTSLASLLPEHDQTLRCSDHAQQLSIKPGGSSLAVERIVVIDLPPPWPKPVVVHPAMVELDLAHQASVLPTRLLAAVPLEGKPEFGITVFQQVGLSMGRWAAFADSQAELEQMVIEITGSKTPLGEVLENDFEPTLLVCTQGSHDVCCGSEGSRFADQADAIAGVSVRRVSHLGGHRFAPTAISLPDARMWAQLEAGWIDDWVNKTGASEKIAAKCRGWLGAESGLAQVAELVVFGELGWAVDNLERSVQIQSEDEGCWSCAVMVGDDQWNIEVRQTSPMPGIACRAEGGIPAKMIDQFEVASVDRP